MVRATAQRRFRLSIRTLMIAVALCALFFAPVVWIFRRMQVLTTMERLAAEAARDQAVRARYLAQVSSAQAAVNSTGIITEEQYRGSIVRDESRCGTQTVLRDPVTPDRLETHEQRT